MTEPEVTAFVYIVDDDASVRDSLAVLLSAYGLQSALFSCGTEFIAALPDLAALGCIILDMKLPDLDGLDILAHLAEGGVRLPVIVITAFGDVPRAVAAMKAGAFDFLEKPYSDDALVHRVHQAIALERSRRAAEQTRAEIAGRLAQLTAREHEVLDRLVLGEQNKQIAHGLGISPRTVEIHRARVMTKMQARTLSQLVRMVMSAQSEP